MLMGNGTFLAVADLLEKQTERLDAQARLRERAKAAALDTGRRAQLAQAEARQAALNAAGAAGGDAARTAAVGAEEAARAAARAAEAAVAEARRLALDRGEQWLGADALGTLLAALLECQLVMEGGPGWTSPTVGGVGRRAGVVGGGGSGGASPLQVVQRTCKAIMLQVGVLSEEELKKESPDVRVFFTNVCAREETVVACWMCLPPPPRLFIVSL